MVRRFRKRRCSLIKLRRQVYLISPKKINKGFYSNLEKVLAFKNVKFFQLRLKKQKRGKIIEIAKKIKKITKKNKVRYNFNDYAKIAKIVGADGCHIGQSDGSLKKTKNYLKGKIVGITCHNSKHLAKIAIKNKASYLAFGSFNHSKLKPNAIKANIDILKWAKKNTKKPIVAIGGINKSNYKKLLKSGAKYIAISSFIWDNKKLKPELAIKKFK